ncbi:hypothetical protein K450DRAFT_242928 [Umbelopsis ramanniana AG]|uniref:PITH domain-containing protein n=1 Tax=Umbelopsis ramanniana AG TaxID=1314678 RepID=A0AAD5EBU9_UMBRA|nr:uncharacterized protein K450DRAFT_242928 [Umbelopsis ramanniana AG]KAI8579370.1 hypothetical protein K450DRAFT_242928 [Umbelopsis ramanniana AG]
MPHCHDDHCEHEHEDLPGSGEQALLYSRIDRDNIRCLNEAEPDSGKSVVKPWDQRLDNDKFVESDADEQLLITIPFTGSVKLRSICLRSGHGDYAPSKLKVYTNRDGIDFDDVSDMQPVQEWDLVRGSDDVVEYTTRSTKFSNVRNITLFFPENYGEDTSIVRFLGFKGEWSEVKRDPIITIYEASANPADHKNPAAEDKLHYSID